MPHAAKPPPARPPSVSKASAHGRAASGGPPAPPQPGAAPPTHLLPNASPGTVAPGGPLVTAAPAAGPPPPLPVPRSVSWLGTALAATAEEAEALACSTCPAAPVPTGSPAPDWQFLPWRPPARAAPPDPPLRGQAARGPGRLTVPVWPTWWGDTRRGHRVDSAVAAATWAALGGQVAAWLPWVVDGPGHAGYSPPRPRSRTPPLPSPEVVRAALPTNVFFGGMRLAQQVAAQAAAAAAAGAVAGPDVEMAEAASPHARAA